MWSKRTSPAGAIALAVVVLASCGPREPPLVVKPPGAPQSLLIRNVAIFDGVNLARTPARDVLLAEGRIRRIAPAGTFGASGTGTGDASGALVVDGSGQTLLPGLIDMHGHVAQSSAPVWSGAFPNPERNLESYLYAGVTTVLDPADLATDAFSRRDAVGRGEVLGPHIFAAGPMFTVPGSHPVPAFGVLVPWYLRWYVKPRALRIVPTPEAARKAVAELAPSRPDVIKVVVDAVPAGVPVTGPDVLRAIVDEGRTHGIRVVAHIGGVADALAAADAGIAAWMHSVYKERIPDDLIPRFAAAGIPCVATIAVFDSYADLFEGKREATALERETVPASILAAFVPVPSDYDLTIFREYFAQLAATRQARRDNVRRLHAAGVTILAGADAQSGVFPGPGLHRELALLVAAGLTPAEALRAATSAAARFLVGGAEPEFGIVAEGKIADLVLVEGDPTTDITRSERIRAVIQGGKLLERHALPL